MNAEAYEVVYYSPDFRKNAERLVEKKKFRRLPKQIADLVDDFGKGKLDGDVLIHSDSPPYDVFKVRLPNSDAGAGKSNGYRIVYLAMHDERAVAFLLIYYKKEQESVAESYVSALLDGYFLRSLPEED